MRRAVAYGVLIAVPPAFAVGTGLVLITQDPLVGAGFAIVLGVVLFGIILVGSEYGSQDDGSVGDL